MSSDTFDVTAATTFDEPTTPKGIFRGTSNCKALTRHNANKAWAASTAASATTTFLVTLRPPAPAARRCRVTSQLLSHRLHP